jgi:8-oxo-dGTP pyrophosphatase MutT (NUDIX family)
VAKKKKKIQTGRAMVHFPYRSRTTGKTYNSVLLSFERASGKYSLPGGKFHRKKDETTLDTALRELEEETGLKGDRASAKLVRTYNGHVCNHDIYLIEARGTLNVDRKELMGVGFYNAGNHNQIPSSRLEKHVNGVSMPKKVPKGKKNKVNIPGSYFVKTRRPGVLSWIINNLVEAYHWTMGTNLIDWNTQRKNWN